MTTCKKHIIGATGNYKEFDGICYIYEGENIPLELDFDYCPSCGEKIEVQK